MVNRLNHEETDDLSDFAVDLGRVFRSRGQKKKQPAIQGTSKPKRKQGRPTKVFLVKITCFADPATVSVARLNLTELKDAGLGVPATEQSINGRVCSRIPLELNSDQFKAFLVDTFPKLADTDFTICFAAASKALVEIPPEIKDPKQIKMFMDEKRHSKSIFLRPCLKINVPTRSTTARSVAASRGRVSGSEHVMATATTSERGRVPRCQNCFRVFEGENCLVCQQDAEYEESLRQDQEKSARMQEEEEVRLRQEDRLKQIKQERRSRLPVEPLDGFIVRARLASGKLLQRRHHSTDYVSVFIDFIGSCDEATERFLVKPPGQVVIDSSVCGTNIKFEDIGVMSRTVVDVSWIEATADPSDQPKENQQDVTVSESESDTTFVEAGTPTEDVDPGVSQLSDLDHLPQSPPRSPTPPGSPMPPSLTVPQPQLAKPVERNIVLHRANLVNDLIEAFQDEVIEENVRFDFIDTSGEAENGIGVGVNRDSYTAFWGEFLEHFCDGEEERVPVVRAGFTLTHWAAIGRIFVKGYRDFGILPLSLSRAFIVSALFGLKAVYPDLLFDSLFSFISAPERVILKAALTWQVEEDDSEELMDILARFGIRNMPTKENICQLLLDAADKELLQKPAFIIEAFREIFTPFQKAFPSTVQLFLDSLLSLKPNTKKVVSLLRANPETVDQRTSFQYLRQFIRAMNPDQLAKFLRFVTGSSVLCCEEITVSFLNSHGLNRHPIARTCGPLLELPSSYSSYSELRVEFSAILVKERWEFSVI